MKTSLTRHWGAHSHQQQGAFQAPHSLLCRYRKSSADIGAMKLCPFSILRLLMVFSHHQLVGRSQQFPWCHLWPILLKYSSFPGNNSQYDQKRISLPILMYYIWETCNQRTKAGTRKDSREWGEKKNRRTFVWFNLTNAVEKKGSCTSGGREAQQNDLFFYYYINLNADLSD